MGGLPDISPVASPLEITYTLIPSGDGVFSCPSVPVQ